MTEIKLSNATTELRINPRDWQAEYQRLMSMPDPYERFLLGCAFFSDWADALEHGEQQLVVLL